MDDFVKFTNWLYADCPYYVPDLEMDIRNTFNPRKNAGLEYSVLQPFIAYNEAGKPVGCIAGIINYRANQKWQTKNVRFGFIDFIDDLEVSAALLKAVEQWGKEHGMNYIQGPMGIFDFDKEGMLIEDFDKLGSMITIYNYPYYPKHCLCSPSSAIQNYQQILPVIQNENEEVIGVAITMGSLSHALQKAKGKLFPLGWYHLVRALKWKKRKKPNCS